MTPKLTPDVNSVSQALDVVARYERWLKDETDSTPHPGYTTVCDAAVILARFVSEPRSKG